MNRRLLAAVALVAMLALAGCSTILGPDVEDPEALSEEADYDFDTDRDAYIEINQDNYTAVYNVSAKTTGDNGTIELYRTDAFAIERPLELHALQFRYPNGTVVKYVDGEPTRVYPNGTTERTDELAVDATRQRAIVHLPHDEGKIAFTTPKNGKQVALEPPVEGSYEVALPPNADASIPLLSQVRPSSDDRQEIGDRVHLVWEDLDSSVLILRWYLDRDIWLFGGLTAIATAVGIVGAVYYYLQIQRAKDRREEEGIDIDYDDDDRDGPPPGMR
jgi:hypothetical protein